MSSDSKCNLEKCIAMSFDDPNTQCTENCYTYTIAKIDESGKKYTENVTTKLCEKHHNCRDLNTMYKNACNLAKPVSCNEISGKNLDKFSLSKLDKQIQEYKENFIKNENCYSLRDKFSRTCVFEPCKDKGHENIKQKFQNRAKLCQTEINKLVSNKNHKIEEKKLFHEKLKAKLQAEIDNEKEIREQIRKEHDKHKKEITKQKYEKKKSSKDEEDIDQIIKELKDIELKNPYLLRVYASYLYSFLKINTDDNIAFEELSKNVQIYKSYYNKLSGEYNSNLSQNYKFIKRILLTIQQNILNNYKKMIELLTDHYIKEIEDDQEYKELDPKLKQIYLEVEIKDIITNEKHVFTGNLVNIYNIHSRIFRHNYSFQNINCILDLHLDNNYSFDGLNDIFEYMILLYYNIIMFSREIGVNFIPENLYYLLDSKENINVIICKINDKLPKNDKLFKKY